MKKHRNIICIILIILLLIVLTIIPNYCYAKDTLGLGDLNEYEGTSPGSDKLVNKANILVSSIRVIGVILSVVILIIIGIKYMLGSVEEKANYKATMIPYIIGCVIAVSGTTIVSFIYNAVH